MAHRNSCSHFCTATNIPVAEILKNKDVVCADCDSRGPNLWICLYNDCFKIGCSEKDKDHSTEHNHDLPMHCIHMNLSTKRIWCYQCQSEVFIDAHPTMSCADSDQDADDYHSKSHDSGHGSYSTLRTNTPDRNRAFPFDRTVGLNVGMNGDTSESSDGEDNVRLQPNRMVGLVGLQNIGNTCYMNAALQALSNTMPLTNFFLECPSTVRLLSEGRKPGLSRTYLELMKDMWVKKTGGSVTPSGILYGIRNVYAMFRGYHQHDTQEFLRNFMDQLHEELKQLCPPEPAGNDLDTFSLAMDEPTLSSSYDSSEGEYETCDSGVSERSSLSDDAENTSNTTKRRLSRSTSPGRRLRARMQNKQPTVDTQPCSISSTKKPPKYRSIISDVFDGKLLSSVQCLTCDRISSCIETFQDLSLPIPSRDHLVVLHGRSTGPGVTCSEAVIPVQEGWLAWILAWLKSWFYGPTVSLHDCLAAFFSTDELKGDNMYSCERCNKLRNGIKFSKVMQLPEVLCIHLKRFRHELMFSSKISSFVSFPLKNLDMRPYLHDNCVSKVTTYDLFSVICHHGTAGGGHYTCYSLNAGEWYEFDDQYITKVTPETVQNCEAYVLFYRKSTNAAEALQNKIIESAETIENDSKEFGYVSKQWLNRFYTFAEPGPIDNSDFLCQHGSIHPERISVLDQVAEALPKVTCDLLYRHFGGCPPVTTVHICPACQNLLQRVTLELETFYQIRRDTQNQDTPPTHLLSVSWYSQWQNFVQKRTTEPPGPIDNSKITVTLSDSEYFEINESVWNFFYNIYGGGPEILIPRVEQEDHDAEEIDEEDETPLSTVTFKIPTLRKAEEQKINPSIYSHGEPMDTESEKKVQLTYNGGLIEGDTTICPRPMEQKSESTPEQSVIPSVLCNGHDPALLTEKEKPDEMKGEHQGLEHKYKQHFRYKTKQKNRHHVHGGNNIAVISNGSVMTLDGVEGGHK
ncbi:ubiquitin carboxyl-terminal hydrolase 20 [Agrilus planipennis]|uniref:Ubiquitin carboxyl-terminal hydrolase n=1 Tax=Agrilus planipennis TaxID=224129 RepID=A0A1W4X7C2_AGRPL|nr:ubiquitin carboxyl-terminal hydrolase 20 [Agrilus planipennis]XP_018331939.1 ubiquitin carboxyl-terminal hydrolase 20 [Agrilus planipennis]